MKVLFVDGEELVLRGIERALHCFEGVESADWEVCFITTVTEALEEMRRAPADVVVCDIGTRDAGGISLLETLAAEHPASLRIVLSGSTDEASALRVAPVAQQFLGKPCAPDVLHEVLVRASRSRKALPSERMRAVLGAIGSVPAPPRLFMQMTQLLSRPDFAFADVTRLLARHPLVSAKILQVANSSFFGRGGRVTDLQQALMRLGLEAVKNIVLTAQAIDQEHAVRASARVDCRRARLLSARAMSLASRFATSRLEADAATSASLLSEVGVPLLAQAAPPAFEAVQFAMAQGRERSDAEREVLGFTHADLACYVLGIWGLPPEVVEPVAHHHGPPPKEWGVRAVVYAATALAESRPIDMEWLRAVCPRELFEEVEDEFRAA